MRTFKITILIAALFAFIACGNTGSNQVDSQQNGSSKQLNSQEESIQANANESEQNSDAEAKDDKGPDDDESDKNSGGSAEPVHLDKSMFLDKVFDYEKNPKEWKFKGNRPCIIDFYADWCGPCKKVAPIMDNLAEKYEGKVDVYKIDTDEQKELAKVFGIKSIPSVMFCPKNGKPAMYKGAFPKSKYEKLLNKHFEL